MRASSRRVGRGGNLERRRHTDPAPAEMTIPDFATHYHLADRAPFLNLSELAPQDLDRVIDQLAQRRRSSGLKRIFGRRYMEMRRLTEARLYGLFVDIGGRPERRTPHYFCLGSSEWFRQLAPDMREVTV